MLSVKYLYEFFEGNTELLNPCIVWDLFGYKNWTKDMKLKENRDDTLDMFLGLFKGLYIMDVTYKEIYRCFIENKLDDLIHIKYSINKSDYYREFCEKQIKIGKTFLNINKNEYSENEEEQIPYIYSKIQPPYHYIEFKTTLSEKSIGCKDKIFLNKISGYKIQDIDKGRPITSDYVTINDIKKMLFKQENKCYVCGDNVITEEWEPKCLYQFTLDRIDNNIPHNTNNVLVCCQYCNCYGWHDDDTDICLYKLCQNKCHRIKRNITRNRNDVSKTEIQKLLIK